MRFVNIVGQTFTILGFVASVSFLKFDYIAHRAFFIVSLPEWTQKIKLNYFTIKPYYVQWFLNTKTSVDASRLIN